MICELSFWEVGWEVFLFFLMKKWSNNDDEERSSEYFIHLCSILARVDEPGRFHRKKRLFGTCSFFFKLRGREVDGDMCSVENYRLRKLFIETKQKKKKKQLLKVVNLQEESRQNNNNNNNNGNFFGPNWIVHGGGINLSQPIFWTFRVSLQHTIFSVRPYLS